MDMVVVQTQTELRRQTEVALVVLMTGGGVALWSAAASESTETAHTLQMCVSWFLQGFATSTVISAGPPVSRNRSARLKITSPRQIL